MQQHDKTPTFPVNERSVFLVNRPSDESNRLLVFIKHAGKTDPLPVLALSELPAPTPFLEVGDGVFFLFEFVLCIVGAALGDALFGLINCGLGLPMVLLLSTAGAVTEVEAVLLLGDDGEH